jgi:riboflavin kinase / FMN adenylyltransferase
MSGAVVTIGNFDGVHRGHLALVDRTVERARAAGVASVAVTFDPHPAAVLRPDDVPLLLQSVDERVAALRAQGLDDVVVIAFTEELAAQGPDEFVRDLLVDRLAVSAVVVGENFRFGHAAKGDVEVLRELGRTHGFEVEAVPLVSSSETTLSSSTLRALLATGDLDAVTRGLGRRFRLSGEVVAGDGRGRTIGVPTANVALLPGRAVPADGVYACWARTGPASEPQPSGRRHAAVTNVGWRPTFGGTSRTVEVHLLDAPDGLDLYGTTLTIDFVARIRGEQHFDGPETLVARIHADIEEARGLLGTA